MSRCLLSLSAFTIREYSCKWLPFEPFQTWYRYILRICTLRRRFCRAWVERETDRQTEKERERERKSHGRDENAFFPRGKWPSGDLHRRRRRPTRAVHVQPVGTGGALPMRSARRVRVCTSYSAPLLLRRPPYGKCPAHTRYVRTMGIHGPERYAVSGHGKELCVDFFFIYSFFVRICTISDFEILFSLVVLVPLRVRTIRGELKERQNTRSAAAWLSSVVWMAKRMISLYRRRRDGHGRRP